MNENKANYAKIGFFILSGTILLGTVIAIACAKMMKQEVIYAETYFTESVSGLDAGAAVKYRGVQIGSVKSVGFTSDEYEGNLNPDSPELRNVMVVFSLFPEKIGRKFTGEQATGHMKKRIEQGLRVKLASSGITGMSFLELDYDDKAVGEKCSTPWKPKNLFIPAKNSTLTAIRNTVDGLMEKLNKIDFSRMSTNAMEMMSSVSRTVREQNASLGDVMGELKSTLQEIRFFIKDLSDNPSRMIFSSPPKPLDDNR
jgi:ABC-type transporter Mla subunit MlaD